MTRQEATETLAPGLLENVAKLTGQARMGVVLIVADDDGISLVGNYNNDVIIHLLKSALQSVETNEPSRVWDGRPQ